MISPKVRLRLALAGATVLFVLAGLPLVALAHAGIVSTDPAAGSVLFKAPARVTMRFSEPIEPRFSEITVLNAQGEPVDNRDSAVDEQDRTALTVTLPPLPDGIYTVSWKNLSTSDGHGLSGTFVFSVNRPLTPAAASGEAPPLVESPAQPILRWLVLLSILGIVGVLGFERFVSQPTFAATAGSPALRRMASQNDARALGFCWFASVVLALASFGELLVKASVSANLSIFQAVQGPVWTLAAHTSWGHLWLWRIGLLLVVAGVLLIASREAARYQGAGRRDWPLFALFPAAGVLLTLSLTSHAFTESTIRTAATFSDYLHLLAAGFWIGGLFYLGLVAPPVMRAWGQPVAKGGAETPSPRRVFSRSVVLCGPSHLIAINRFSVLAILSVGTLFITGPYSAWAQVTVASALGTPYGKALLIKLAVMMPLMLVGAFNCFKVRLALAKDGRALQWLKWGVAGQSFLSVAVLLAAGVLASMEPARQVASRELGRIDKQDLKVTVERLNLELILQPGTVGTNIATILLTDSSGQAVTNASAVTMQLTYKDRDIGTLTEPAIDHGNGGWLVHQANLSVAGDWEALVVVQRPDAFDARATFRFRVVAAGSSVNITPSAGTGQLLWGIEYILLGILFGATGLAQGKRLSRAALASVVCGGVMASAGLALVVVTLV